jgi:hypothetical protein
MLFTKRILFLLALMLPLTGAAQTMSATPPGYSLCSRENGACSFTGPLNVAYGAEGSFVFRTLTNGTTCDNGSFGEDPAPGIVKACYVPTIPPMQTFCAAENGTCSFNTTDTVAYGASGRYVFDTFTNQTNCANSAFGQDPAPGIAKNCFVPAWPPLFTFCSWENGTCNFGTLGNPPNVDIAYGENGNFVFRHFTGYGSTPCTSAVFGEDPAPGSVKRCLLSGYTATPPYGYNFCSGENGNCAFEGTRRVAYGVNGNFTFQTFTNGTACNNAAFNEDPAPGIIKACYIPTDPPGYTACSAENGTCHFNGTATVAYGADGDFVYRNANNGITCNNFAFGHDPKPGIVKSCYIPAGPVGFDYCSSENGTCKLAPGALGEIVYYGFNGGFIGKSFGGSVACNNTAFGSDPAPGIVKSCFVQQIFAQ